MGHKQILDWGSYGAMEFDTPRVESDNAQKIISTLGYLMPLLKFLSLPCQQTAGRATAGSSFHIRNTTRPYAVLI